MQSATISGSTVVAVGGAGSKTGGDGFNEYGTVKVTGGSVTLRAARAKRKMVLPLGVRRMLPAL